MKQSISDFINRKIVVLDETESVYQAARALCNKNVGAVIVAARGVGISGILTDRDIVCQLVAENLNPQTPIAHIMSDELVTVSENASMDEAIELMIANGIRRLPVIHQSRIPKCIGIITCDDLLSKDIAETVKDYRRLAEILQNQLFEYHESGHKIKENGHASTDRFYQKIANKLGIRRSQARQLTYQILPAIVRRLHHSGANQLISHLPKKLHDEFSYLPAGPDREIDGSEILRNVCEKLQLSPDQARRAVTRYWHALYNKGNAAELNQVVHQLPKSMKLILTGEDHDRMDQKRMVS